MNRYKIVHQTLYCYSSRVRLQAHTLRLRPREGHELRIERSQLDIYPTPSLRWHRDAEGNSVAIATFDCSSDHLSVKCETIVQQYDQTPYDFWIASYAQSYPFDYLPEDRILLAPYLYNDPLSASPALGEWIYGLHYPGEPIHTYALLQRLNQRTHQALSYCVRDEPGVQTPEQSLVLGTGSCRDSAVLFMAAAKRMGFAARFVSGYTYAPVFAGQAGSTHAWAEVFIPGAGWKGFDPTTGEIVGANHVAVAVARRPQAVPPIEGSYLGASGSRMSVGVWVTELN